MPQAIIKYDLNDADDLMSYERSNKSLDMALALWEFAYNSKKKIEWDVEKSLEDNPNLSQYDVIDKIYARFWEIVDEHNIKIDNLII